MATLYVDDATGNDATTKAANNNGNKWKTIGRAAWGSTNRAVPVSGEAVAAGDTVEITGGTYADNTTVVNGEQTPLYTPTNSGTSGAPIIFTTSGTVTLTSTSCNSPVIGSSATRDYVQWIGHFYCDEANINTAPDTGVAAITNCTGCMIDGAELDGNGIDTWMDNHTGIRVEIASAVTIRNCTIYDVLSDYGENNGAGIQIYGGSGLTIEHNHIYGCGSGVFFKDIGAGPAGGSPASATSYVRLNKIHDCFTGIDTHRVLFTSASLYVLSSQNIIYSCTQGLLLHGFAGDGPTNIRHVNNTVDACTYGMLNTKDIGATANILLQNNLFTNLSAYTYFEEDPIAELWDSTAMISAVRNFAYVHTTNYSYTYDEGSASNKNFTAFKAAHPSQDVDSVDGTDPVYTNQAGRDYHISGATALAAGRAVHGIGGSDGTIIAVGAYITGNEVIGPTDEDTSVHLMACLGGGRVSWR